MISKRHRYDPGEYAILPREVINNSALSFDARGLLLYLLEKPADWVVTNEYLYNQSPGGERHINTILKELKTAGYVHRERVLDPTCGFRWDTTVYDFPEDNPHHKKGSMPTKRSDGMPTVYMDAKRSDILITDLLIEERGAQEPIEPKAPPQPPAVVYGSIDRTPGGKGFTPPPEPKPRPVHPTIQLIIDLAGVRPKWSQERPLVDRLGEYPNRQALAKAINAWTLSGNNPLNFLGICDWYDAICANPDWKPLDRYKQQNGGDGEAEKLWQRTVQSLATGRIDDERLKAAIRAIGGSGAIKQANEFTTPKLKGRLFDEYQRVATAS